jgi:FtsP/CotA-like multicopper oxidase with cupredoxin domain
MQPPSCSVKLAPSSAVADPDKERNVSNEPTVTRDDEQLAPLGMPTPLLVFATVAVLCIALVATIVTVGSRDKTAAIGAPLSAHVALSEFKIEPAAIEVAQGGSLHIQNDGAIAHNLSVADTDLKTPDIVSGQAADLDVSSLAAGSYQVLCLIPGHADSGMKASLTVVSGAGGAAASSTDHTSTGGGSGSGMNYDQMTKDMLASFGKYPEKTKGEGNTHLDPTEVRADGTKVFDFDMQVADWEVSAGNTVKAWTFNGMVPGPRIDLQVGDKVEIRVKNDLEIATDMHLHGLNVDNAYDGVSPLTQDLIQPGDTFTYKFVADEVSVAMYHPHAHGHLLLPNGMFGVVLVGQVNLPRGGTVSGYPVPADLQVSQEFPMVLNDSGVIGYSLNGKSFPATAPISAKLGDWILVHYFNEGTLIHPMHLHQFDQIVVAKDGYALDVPYVADTVNVAPGERYSVLVKIDKPGAWVWHCHILPHVERETGMYGMVTALIAS